MDPYCILYIKEKEFRTSVKKEAGKQPIWNESFDIDVKDISDELTIKVMDKNICIDQVVGHS